LLGDGALFIIEDYSLMVRTMDQPRTRLVSWISAFICVALTFSGAVVAKARVAELADGGMVATRSSWASQVGADILSQGGNAVDAAVAVGFAMAVTYPSAGNLGGGGFMVIHLADGTVITNDHREKAPSAASRDMFLDENGDVIKELSLHSHLAAGVPGSVAGLLDVLEKHGTMTRAQVIQPAIDLAAKGIVLDRDMAEGFARRAEAFAKYPASAGCVHP
jgi:gamma-glutamyltranspeptidase/glutathione hydrolase